MNKQERNAFNTTTNKFSLILNNGEYAWNCAKYSFYNYTNVIKIQIWLFSQVHIFLYIDFYLKLVVCSQGGVICPHAVKMAATSTPLCWLLRFGLAPAFLWSVISQIKVFTKYFQQWARPAKETLSCPNPLIVCLKSLRQGNIKECPSLHWICFILPFLIISFIQTYLFVISINTFDLRSRR